VVGKVDKDVVWRVVRTVKGQFRAFAPDPQHVGIAERHLRGRPCRVVVPKEEPPCLLVANPDDVVAKKVGGTCVVRMVMGVDDMGDGIGDAFSLGNLVYCAAQVVADRRRGIEQDYPLIGGKESGLVGTVGDPEQVPLDAPDIVALVIEGWPECGLRDRHVVGK
jgi:hypothetical protein